MAIQWNRILDDCKGTSFIEPPFEEPTSETVAAKINGVANRKRHVSLDSVSIPNVQVSQILTLADFRILKTQGLQEKLIQPLNLKTSFDLINSSLDFYDRLEKTTTRILNQITLFSVQMLQISPQSFAFSRVYMALAEPEKILTIDVNQLKKIEDIAMLTLRLSEIEPSLQIEEPASDEESLSVARLRTFSKEQILKIKDQLPVEAFQSLKESQFLELDFTELNSNQIKHLFTQHKLTIRQRLSLCSLDRFKIMLEKGAMTPLLLEALPDEAIPSFPLDLLPKDKIKHLFTNRSEQQKRAAIQSLPSTTIQSLLNKDLVTQEFLQHLSNEQIASLDFLQLTEDQQEAVLSSPLPQERRQKMSAIPTDLMNDWLATMPLKFFKNLSDAQIQALDTSRLTVSQIKYLFPTLEIADFYEGTYSRTTLPSGRITHSWYLENEYGIQDHSECNENILKKLEERRATCKKHLDLLSNAQLHLIKNHLSLEILALKPTAN